MELLPKLGKGSANYISLYNPFKGTKLFGTSTLRGIIFLPSGCVGCDATACKVLSICFGNGNHYGLRVEGLGFRV